MRVLLTCISLHSRSGAELWVLDAARALRRRGHEPAAYSRVVGPLAEEFRAEGLLVVDDLDALPWVPDVIHGQHVNETMTAVLRFPASPAVAFCHDARAWHDAMPDIPGIARYVAVDVPTRSRLIDERGIDPTRVRVVQNFVDLDRFQPRSALPERPLRALLLSNQVKADVHVPAVRVACERQGIELDIAGLGVGAPEGAPERRLPLYDVVFAKARAAMEAMAVGAAVILCDAEGVGPLVTMANFCDLRPLNFGFRTLQEPLSAEAVERRLRCYDRAEAEHVSMRARAELGLEDAIDRLVDIYHEAREITRARPRDAAEDSRAASRYLADLSAPLRNQAFTTWERDKARDDARRLAAVEAQLRTQLADAQADLDSERELRAQAASRASEMAEQVRSAALLALADARAQRDQAAARAARDRAALDGLERSATWRARARVLRLPGVRRVWGILDALRAPKL